MSKLYDRFITPCNRFKKRTQVRTMREEEAMMTPERAVSSCLGEWVKRYGHLTFRTLLIPVPEAFVRYLRKVDGPLVLPKTAIPNWEPEDSDDDEVDWGESPASVEVLAFPDFEKAIAKAIRRLGGSTFIKLNWRSPRDGSWMIGGTECTSAADVFGLLKASQNILTDVQQTEVPLTLALREFWELEPALEFRVFVKNNTIVAACQRKADTCFNYSQNDLTRFRHKIATFFDEHLRRHSGDFVFDVYIAPRRTYLVGIKDAKPPTSALLFDWKDIQSFQEDQVLPSGPTRPEAFELRVCVASDSERDDPMRPPVIPSEMRNSRAPSDVLDLANLVGLDGLIDTLKQQAKDENHNYSSSSSDSHHESDQGDYDTAEE